MLTHASVTVVDFETEAIKPPPAPPPRPVGVSIKRPGKKPVYLAWAHPTGNNTDQDTATRQLRDIWKREHVLCHSPFDFRVARYWLKLEPPSADRMHDTTVQAFLHDPNRPVLSLKPLCEELLGIPPTEQTRLRDWIIENVPEARRAKKDWGAYIARAPAELVAPYANGDTDRPLRLMKFFGPSIYRSEAYQREQRVMRCILDMERDGIPIDVDGLEGDVERAERDLEFTDNWLRKRLKTPHLEVGKSAQLIEAFERCGIVDEWILTDTGQPSVAYENLVQVILDKHRDVLAVLEYRGLLANQLQTFARPWLNAVGPDNTVHVEWNQVRQAGERKKGRSIGARTGRLSSTPNAQNIPKEARVPVAAKRGELSKHLHLGSNHWADKSIPVPVEFVDHGCQLIDLRDRIRARRGERLGKLDYNQQELRILAHYSGGDLAKTYRENPTIDFHTHAQTLVNAMLKSNFQRKPIKNLGFGIIYGMGLTLLSEQMGVDYDTAKLLRATYKKIFPGLADLERKLKKAGFKKETLWTWGNRPFVVEPPKMTKHGLRTFEYKLLNTLIQGSAADCTKEAMVRYFEDRGREGRLILSVHDELVIAAPSKVVKIENARLAKAMQSVQFDVPMLADGTTGATWRECA